MVVRRWLATRTRDQVGDRWPILHGSEKRPEGWSGWPGGKKFAVVLTHDVEGKPGLEKVRPLVALEEKLGFRSSFNFVPEGSYRVSTEMRQDLKKRGFEVGVHDLRHDGKLYRSQREFANHSAKLNEYLKNWDAVGFRSGFMLRNLDWLHEIDISYDASTFDTDPFEPQPDGSGTIFPFWISRESTSDGFQAGSRTARKNGYVELPYTLAQDSTLFLLFRETSPAIWLRKLDWVAENGGMVLVNVHPDYVRFAGEPAGRQTYPVEYYETLLNEIKRRYEGSYWPALPREVASWFVETQCTSSGARASQPRVTTPLFDPVPVCGGDREVSVVRSEASPGGCPDVSEKTSNEPNGATVSARSTVDPTCAETVDTTVLRGKRAAVVIFSDFMTDPRPRRAGEILVQHGMAVDVICLRGNELDATTESKNGFNISRVPLKRDRGGKLSYIYQYSKFLAAAFVKLSLRSLSRRYDLVHVHNMPDILVFSALIPKLQGSKLILDLHDPMPELMLTIFGLKRESFMVRLLCRIEKWSTAFADLVLTVNIASKRIYSSRSCPPGKIGIVMNSPNEKIFAFRSAPSAPVARDGTKPFVIMYHGSLFERNGFDLGVDALELVRKRIPDAVLLVCGESTPYLENVMASAKARHLESSIRYLGKQNREQIVAAIDSCDIGIIPNRRSTFTEMNTPTRIFEYLSRGKPVVAPRAQGIQDYFGEDDLLFFELGDAADLARKIELAYSDPGWTLDVLKRGQGIYLRHRWSSESLGFTRSIVRLLDGCGEGNNSRAGASA